MFHFMGCFLTIVIALWGLLQLIKWARQFDVHFDHADQVPAVGMRNIVLRAPRQFYLIVGFWYRLPFDLSFYIPYGVERSDSTGMAVIDTFLGEKGCRFTFITSINAQKNNVMVTSNDFDQQLAPTSRHTKWPWQK
jgi:hypothetical protein